MRRGFCCSIYKQIELALDFTEIICRANVTVDKLDIQIFECAQVEFRTAPSQVVKGDDAPRGIFLPIAPRQARSYIPLPR